MHIFRLALLCATFLPVARAADSDHAAHWLPLDAGNEWIFSDGDGTHRVGVDYASGNYYWVTGLLGLDYWVWSSDTAADLWQYNSGTGTWDTLFEPASSAWDIQLSGSACTSYQIAPSTASSSHAGAQTWSFVLDPEPNVRCAAKQMQDITFAPGIGPVAFDSARDERWTLQGARIDGEWIAEAADSDQDGALEVTILTDAADYPLVDTGIRCITTPCPSSAPATALVTIVLANTGDEELVLDFSSGLQVDVDVYNADGYWIWSWSDDQMFTQAATRITLQPGERELLTRKITAVDADGEPLVGDLALAVWVPGVDAYPAVWLTAGQ
jgi:hypothetical protein